MAGSGRHRVGASPAAVVTLALFAFAAGAVGGAIGHHQWTCACDKVWSRSGRSWKSDQLEQWSHVLALDAGQQRRLEEALDSVHARYRALYAELSPQKRAIDEELRAKVRGFLDERQRARYDEALAENDRRRATYYGNIDPRAVQQPIAPASGEAARPPSHPE